MVVGDDRVVPGILLGFEDGRDMDDDDPVEVADVVGSRIDIRASDGVVRYILIGREPVTSPSPSESIAGGI
jgi:hypothetical protein